MKTTGPISIPVRIISHPKSLASVRRREPLTFGLPLPRGFTSDARHWTCGPANESGSAIQTRVLDRWIDGSARWLLVDVQADLVAGETDLFISNDSTPGEILNGITIVPTENGLIVDTTAARFHLQRGSALPFHKVETRGQPPSDGISSSLEVVTGSAARHRVSIEALEIEERGPLRTCVRANGCVHLSKKRRLEVTARIHFFVGLPTVRCLITLRNPHRAVHPGGFWDLGDSGSILIKSATITLGVPASALTPDIRVSTGRGEPWRTLELPLRLYQDSSGGERWQSRNHINRDRTIPNTFRGYRLSAGRVEESGLRATPIVMLRTDREQVAMTMPHFWQNFPKAIEADGSGVRLHLFPGDYADLHEIQGGEQKTHECFLSFGDDTVTDPPLEWCRDRAVVCLDAQWCESSEAIPFLAPLGDAHAALVNSAVDGEQSFDVKREVIDEYGWRHFGEIYGDHESVRQKEAPIVSHYNNQYDPIAGFALQFLRTGDLRWRAMMDDLAHHIVDVDVYHTIRDKSAYNHGLFWHTYHYGDADTATHRTYPAAGKGVIHGGGPSADHNYTAGLMLHYFLTGDESSRAAAIDLARFVIDMDDGRKTVFRWLDRGDTGRAGLSAAGYYGPGRGSANSLDALMNGHRLTGQSEFLVKAEQIIRRAVHPDEDIARHRLDVPELRWFYTMFLQGLGRYLHRKVELAQIDEMYAYGRAALLHYARWMAAHEHPYLEKPEKLEFPTETWAAQDIRKSDALYFAALHACGPERAVFVERAAFFYQYSTTTLAQSPTRALARPVIVLLTSGFMYSWYGRHIEASEPEPQVGLSFAGPELFVSQKDRALRKFVMLSGAAAIAVVLLLVGLFLR